MSFELFKDDLLYLTKQHQDDFYSFFKKFLQSNSNLIFCSTNPAIANYYSNFFEKKISNFENIKVEKFFPNDSETVINKFNSILKEVSMVGNDMMLDPGIGTCGKAGQGVPVGVAQPSILINKMTVGGTKL